MQSRPLLISLLFFMTKKNQLIFGTIENWSGYEKKLLVTYFFQSSLLFNIYIFSLLWKWSLKSLSFSHRIRQTFKSVLFLSFRSFAHAASYRYHHIDQKTKRWVLKMIKLFRRFLTVKTLKRSINMHCSKDVNFIQIEYNALGICWDQTQNEEFNSSSTVVF